MLLLFLQLITDVGDVEFRLQVGQRLGAKTRQILSILRYINLMTHVLHVTFTSPFD